MIQSVRHMSGMNFRGGNAVISTYLDSKGNIIYKSSFYSGVGNYLKGYLTNWSYWVLPLFIICLKFDYIHALFRYKTYKTELSTHVRRIQLFLQKWLTHTIQILSVFWVAFFILFVTGLLFYGGHDIFQMTSNLEGVSVPFYRHVISLLCLESFMIIFLMSLIGFLSVCFQNRFILIGGLAIVLMSFVLLSTKQTKALMPTNYFDFRCMDHMTTEYTTHFGRVMSAHQFSSGLTVQKGIELYLGYSLILVGSSLVIFKYKNFY